MNETKQPLLRVRNLKKHFKKNSGLFSRAKKILTAVDGINFDIYPGETFGLVGESGCGKSTTGRTIIKLHKATDGEVFFDGKRISGGNLELRHAIRLRRIEVAAELKEIKENQNISDADKADRIKEINDNFRDFKNATRQEMKARSNDWKNAGSSSMDDVHLVYAQLRAEHKAKAEVAKKDLLAIKENTRLSDEEKAIQTANVKEVLKTLKTEMNTKINATKKEWRNMNKSVMKDIQMIFQDPYASLNPRMTVTDIISEGIDTHHIFDEAEDPRLAKQERIYELLESVGLKREHASRYPHEFSGGQRQRIGIARALAVEPKLIICDEPISALDVSIQAQVVNMLEDFQKRDGLTYLFIAHDLSMVKYISDRIGVMYLGHMMEITTSDELYEFPLHPYTKALLSSVPVPDPNINKKGKRIVLEGDVPSPINPKPGCRFASRCRYAKTEISRQAVTSFAKALEGKNAFEKVVNPVTEEIIVLQGDTITPPIAELISSLSFETFNIQREKCFTETPALIEVKKEHFTACHFVKEINNL